MHARVDPGVARAGGAELSAVRKELDAGLLRLLDEAVGQLTGHQRREVSGLAGDDLDERLPADRVELRHGRADRPRAPAVVTGGHHGPMVDRDPADATASREGAR